MIALVAPVAKKETVTASRSFYRIGGRSARKYFLRDSTYRNGNEFSRWAVSSDDSPHIRMDLVRSERSKVETRLKGLRGDRISELRVHTAEDVFSARLKVELFDLDSMIKESGAGGATFNANLSVTLSSRHPAGVSRSSTRFERAMDLLGMDFRPVSHYSRRKLRTRLLSSGPQGKYLMDSASAASILPIFFPGAPDTRGVLVGAEASTGLPFFLDQYRDTSHNINVVGETGSGKSFFSKVLAMRSLFDGICDWLIIIDPLNEYEQTFSKMGACTVDLRAGEYFGFDNLTTKNVEKSSPVQMIIDLAEINEEQSAKIRTASEELGTFPNVQDLLARLIEVTTDPVLLGKLHELRLTHFRSQVKIDPERAKIFLIKTPSDLGSERDRMLLSATVSARYLCSVLNGKKLVLIDEMHLFLAGNRTAQHISNFYRNSRHYDTSIIGMTQNIYDLERSESAETIRDNSIALIMFRTRSADFDSHFINLKDFGNPAVNLLMGGKLNDYSECLMLYHQRLKKLRIVATKQEIDLIDSPVP